MKQVSTRPFASAVVLAFVLFPGAAGAEHGGSSTIASAQELHEEFARGGAGETVEFYRMQVYAGDEAAVEFGSVTGAHAVSLDLFEPHVTDATIANATPVETVRAVALGTMFIPGGRTLRWILRVRTPPGGRYNIAPDWAPRDVAARLWGPRTVRVGRRVLLRGRFTGIRPTHSLRVELQYGVGAFWKTVAEINVAPRGSFWFRPRFHRAGRYRVRALFRGDYMHHPALSNILHIRARR